MMENGVLRMNIGRQWADRLRIWGERFDRHMVSRAAQLPVSFFTTMEHLPLEEAMRGSFAPAPVGMTWGKKWEYAWFCAGFTVPQALAGKRLVLHLGMAGEMLVFVNGQAAGAIDKKHAYITLARSAQAGMQYEIYAECYAGHGVRNEGAGPVAYGEETVPEPPEAQETVRESYIGIWNETVFQAAMDYRTLYSLVQRLPDKSLRAMKIVEGLKRFTLEADFELPEPELTQSIARAARGLAPLLACRNGSTAPEYTIFGQSHLDLAWLWPVEETQRKCARTYSNQLALMEEYPEYRFLLCEPPILEILRDRYPQVYERVMEKAAQGAFMPEGALYVEADTNIPSGESLIRQFVRGRRWFLQEAGVHSRMAWMPDTFGFSAALPQIMKKCGVPYFATQKLLRQDPEAEPFPYNLFWWEGLDGSRVLAHVFKKNNAVFTAGDLIARWEDDRIQQENIDGMMFPFGYGDGGGGPTREMLEVARRCRDLEGAPRCRMENPVRYFERALESGVPQVYRGELYLAWHRGTLTAQAKTKRGIRRAEAALKALHYHMARWILSGRALPAAWRERANALEETLLFNQFHDIAPGTSIERVHERAVRELGDVQAGCHALIKEIADMAGETGWVSNPLGWARRFQGVTIPAQGCVRLGAPQRDAGYARAYAENGGFVLENGHLVCRINAQGEVTSVRRAGGGREYLAGPGNRMLMYKDVNTCYDAWEIGSMYEEMPVELNAPAQVSLCPAQDGAALQVRHRLHDSVMTQTIFLGADAQRLDFITRINWQEKHKLLKVAFPIDCRADEAVHEIQFGHVRRPVHVSRQHDRDRYEVCCHRYTALEDGGGGAAVLNDSKYGVSVAGGEIRLTLLRAPMMPDMHADRGEQAITYSLYPFDGPLAASGVLREAAEINEEPTPGFADEAESVLLPLNGNIVVETLRPSDTREDAVLVRAYEAMGMRTEAEFAVGSQVGGIWEVNMLEEDARALRHDGRLTVAFGSFEIKSFLLERRG